ncbi:MAG: adenylate/guanylate cyclase domain-containing protein [Desulfobacterales bacterium]|nr:adenylate/guanylate cyclase domain-containing protein [Desulfobacterales bacterium]MBF0396890.1 adenylate/guanylate cyclase domain-containing protein [Desulfobacterales bacterium]
MKQEKLQNEFILHFVIRFIPIIFSLLFLVMGLFAFHKLPRLISCFYIALLTSCLTMMALLYSLTTYYRNISSAIPLLLVILIVYLFSTGGLPVILTIYITPTLLYCLIMLVYSYPIQLYMSNQITAMVVFSILFYFQEKMRYKEFRAERISEYEKRRSRNLLNLILPGKILKELDENGCSEPVLYESASILFTDFVNFTKICENFSPKELLNELDIIFSAFDLIVEKHGLQKIKTIGDAYMCTGGIPEVNKSHAKDCIHCAIDFISYMKNYAEVKKKNGLPFWEIRIGINSGKVIAGIIGEKFFAYDIWGDSVNVASRMESASEPSKINVSQSTYDLVKTDFRFINRGKNLIKGKGEMSMYFVQTD